jgi:DNA polymerase
MEEFSELARTYISQMVEMGENCIFLERSLPRTDRMKTLMEEVESCSRCSLHTSRKNCVFGEGNPRADIMFVGEAPGREEDLKGRPFVGAAGELLTRMIGAMGLKRSDVYIANVLKCRPPDNRDPVRSEVMACRDFLFRQIELIQPKVICGLGSHATRTLLDTTSSISSLRGKVHRVGSAALVPTYHPAALLRNPGWKRSAWEDLKLVLSFLDSAQGGRQQEARIEQGDRDRKA